MELERYKTIEESDEAFINSFYEVKIASIDKQLAELAKKIEASNIKIKELSHEIS
jgi:hypothetical protein